MNKNQIPDLPGENWVELTAIDNGKERPIWISNMGRVKAFYGKTDRMRLLNFSLNKGQFMNKLLSSVPSCSGFIHKAVAKYFVENPEGKKNVLHKDGDKKNNKASNLEWYNHNDFTSIATNVSERLQRDSVESHCGERWLDAITFDEGNKRRHVLVSNQGRVKFFNFYQKKYILAQTQVCNGHIQCSQLRGSRYSLLVHRTMAQLFLKNPENKKYVIHLDHDRHHNSLSNLEWATQEEVNHHNEKNPKLYDARGKRKKVSKISEGRAKILKKKLLDPERKTRVKMLAKQYGLSEMQLWRIKSGENWGDLEID